MKKIKRVLWSTMAFTMIFSASALADSPSPSPWSYDPPAEEPTVLEPIEAYYEDINGSKTYVRPVIGKKDEMGTSDWVDGRLLYTFDSYSPTTHLSDLYKYYLGTASMSNQAPTKGKVYYAQTSSKTSTWQVSAQIEATPKFANAFLSALGLKFGGSYAKSNTATSSTTISGEHEVSPWKTGYLEAYRPGGYASGAGKFKVTDVQTGQFVSYYYQTNNGWAPKTTDMHFKYYEK